MAKAYVILHGGVAAWAQGAVVPAADFEARKVDTQRLLDLGAIREATADEVQAAQGGDDSALRAPDVTTGSADVPAIPPPPVSDRKGSK